MTGADLPNYAGKFHKHLSRKKLQTLVTGARRESAPEAGVPAHTRRDVFTRTVRADMLSGMLGARQALCPLTIGVDGLLGTNRTDVMEKEVTASKKLKHVCTLGVVGTATNVVGAATVISVGVAGGAVGGVLGGVASPFANKPVSDCVLGGATLGVAGGTAAATYPVMLAAYAVVQGASAVAAVPKLILNGLGGAGGCVYGAVHGGLRALKTRPAAPARAHG